MSGAPEKPQKVIGPAAGSFYSGFDLHDYGVVSPLRRHTPPLSGGIHPTRHLQRGGGLSRRQLSVLHRLRPPSEGPPLR